MKQLRELVNIHLRSGKDSLSTLQIKKLADLVQRDSRSSVHDAFIEARSVQSRLKACQSQMLKTFIIINQTKTSVKIGNNVVYAIAGLFMNDYSISWKVTLCMAEEPHKVLAQEFVDSQNLLFIGKELGNNHDPFPKNTLIFEFDDGYYQLTKALENYMSPTKIDKSYSYDEFTRISNLVHSLSKVHEEIKDFLEKGRNRLLKVKQKSQLEFKAKEIKRSTRAIEASIIEKSHQILSLKSKIYQIKVVLKEKLNLLEESRNAGNKSAKLCIKTRSSILLNRNSLIESRQSLLIRQRDLALETRRIFQIEEGLDGYSINGFIADIRDKNKEKSCTAFGLVAHLVSTIFGLVNLRPRYPILLKGSQSSIIDYISESSLPPMYPLYLKGMDRTRFEYGVFLLNKNIQQLQSHFGIPRKHQLGRDTLYNMYLIIKALEKGPLLQTVLEDSTDQSWSIMDKRSSSPLKSDVWTEASPMFRLAD